MPAAPLLFLTAAAVYAGFQATVHLVVYRQFAAVPATAFAEFERLHQRRISVLVGPLFAALIAAAGWLVIDRPAAVPLWAVAGPAVLVMGILGVTGLLAVPLHRRLTGGWDERSYRLLLRVDLVRTLLAALALGWALALVLVLSG